LIQACSNTNVALCRATGGFFREWGLPGSRFEGPEELNIIDGGMAYFLKTSARSVVKLDPSLHPKDIAALADAGLTAYHAVKKAARQLYPGTKVVVIGAGGLGHIGVQCLKAMTPAQIIVLDRSAGALELAKRWGADHTVLADGKHVAKVKEITEGQGAEAV
jgi:NAD+-dependent secondary alcohol dehydrogenase Adh1